jgi:hypothetical protein
MSVNRHPAPIGLPLQIEHLGRLIGFSISEIAPLNQVVHLWA